MKEGKFFVATCPEVGTSSQGKTVEEAVANLKEAAELYLEEFPPTCKQVDHLRGGACGPA